MHIHKKGNTYHYRQVIPADLKQYINKKELWLTLRTADRSLARYRANVISVFLRGNFQQMLQQINNQQTDHNLSYVAIKDMVQADLDTALQDIKSRIEMLGPLTFSQIAVHENNLEKLRSTYKQDIIPDDEQSELVEDFCKAKGIKPTAREKQLIQRELIKSLVAQEKAQIELSKSFHQEPDINLATASGAAIAHSSTASLSHKTTLGELIVKYKDEQLKAGAWNIKSQYEVNHKLEILAAIIGDTTPIANIGPEKVLYYKESLLKIPAHISKKPEYKNLTVEEILKLPLAKQTLSITTVNKYLLWANALFRWARSNGYVTQNYFENRQLKENKQKASEFRERFTETEIQKLLSNRSSLRKDYQKWFPLILLYTGARVNEIASLYRDDVKQIDSVWVFDINESRDDKRLKNIASRRIIPIHPQLIKAGFLKYIEDFKSEQRIWPELTYGKDGYGRNVSRWFNEKHKVDFNITDKTKTLHSFRHTFADELKQKRVPESLAAALLGHAGSGISYERYGKGYIVETLKPVIEVLDFSTLISNSK